MTEPAIGGVGEEAEAESLELEDALERAVALAPQCESLAATGKAVNHALDMDWSDAKWRGIWKHHPREAEQVRKSVGTQQKRQRNAIKIDGNVRGLVVSDIHAPFHDYNAIRLVAQVAKWHQPDVLIYNGDSLDFYHSSRFDTNPERMFNLQTEIDAWHTDVVAVLSSAVGKQCRQIKTLGNHEDRLRRKLWSNPDLYGIRALQMDSLLELERYGIELVTTAVFFGNHLEVSHGTLARKWSGYSAKAEAEKRRYRISTITGHVHRAGRFETNVRQHRVIAQENPCLCSLDPEYMTDPDWVNGFTLFDVRNGNVRIDVVEIHSDYTCCVGKKWFGVG